MIDIKVIKPKKWKPFADSLTESLRNTKFNVTSVKRVAPRVVALEGGALAANFYFDTGKVGFWERGTRWSGMEVIIYDLVEVEEACVEWIRAHRKELEELTAQCTD